MGGLGQFCRASCSQLAHKGGPHRNPELLGSLPALASALSTKNPSGLNERAPAPLSPPWEAWAGQRVFAGRDRFPAQTPQVSAARLEAASFRITHHASRITISCPRPPVFPLYRLMTTKTHMFSQRGWPLRQRLCLRPVWRVSSMRPLGQSGCYRILARSFRDLCKRRCREIRPATPGLKTAPAKIFNSFGATGLEIAFVWLEQTASALTADGQG